MSSVLLGALSGALLWVALRPRAWPWRVTPDRAAGRPVAPEPRGRSVEGGRRGPARSVGSARRGSDAVPRVADVLAVAAASGAPMAQCVAEVGSVRDVPEPARSAAASLSRGNALEEALGELSSAGDGWHSLATVISLSTGAGRGGADALRRFAHSERLRARRERERRARRLPVLLLLPLTTMVLPAFALATVVPFVVLGDNPLDLPPIPTIPEGP